MKRALLYCRVSTKRQEDNSSLDSQEKTGKDWCKKNGFKIERVTKEVFTGADFFERPKLCLDRADIRAGRFDALVIDCIDRLGRDIAGLAIVAEECKKSNCELVFVNEPLDMSPEGKLITSVRSFVAEVERLKIRERTMRGRRAKILQGRPVLVGPPLYGYLSDKENERWIVNEDEADTVRLIFSLASQSYGVKAIARRLNEQHIPSQSGGLWSSGTIHKMLVKSEYKGVSYANKLVINEVKKIRRRKPSEWVRLKEGTHPAIVDAITFDLVQSLISQHQKFTAKNEKVFILLRGMVFCKICSSPMHVLNSTDRPPSKQYRFRCGQRFSEKERCLSSSSISAHILNPLVWTVIKPFIDEPEKLAGLWGNQSTKTERMGIEIASVEAKIVRAEKGIERLLSTFRNASDALLPHLQKQIDVATREKEMLQGALLALKEKSSQDKQGEDVIQQIKAMAKELSKLKNPADKLKRKFFILLGVKVYIGKDKPLIKLTAFE